MLLQNSMEDAVQDDTGAPSNLNEGTTTVKAEVAISR